jgi:hypothetical protein
MTLDEVSLLLLKTTAAVRHRVCVYLFRIFPMQAATTIPQTPNVKTLPLDNMLRIVTVVQRFMTEFNGAMSEEEKIVAITKIVSNLTKQNGHYRSNL